MIIADSVSKPLFTCSLDFPLPSSCYFLCCCSLSILSGLHPHIKPPFALSVAMTRAKRCLCVVGDSDTVRNGGKFLKDWMEWLEENADVRVVQ
jgi:DNA polymerase alpha-associated DNA helicase A